MVILYVPTHKDTDKFLNALAKTNVFNSIPC